MIDRHIVMDVSPITVPGVLQMKPSTILPLNPAAKAGTIYGIGYRMAALALGAAILGGCSTLRPTQQAFAPDEYQKRHPIVLRDQVEHMDVFATGSRLDQRQYLDVVAFGKDFADNGSGIITAAVPRNGALGGQQQVLASIQQALIEGGVSQRVEVAQYDANPKEGASPIRLSFVKLKAKLAGECGQWPSDLGGGKDLESWHNRPYHNLGCSQQSMIAAQVANPSDLVRPRGEGPSDVAQRVKAIQSLRAGGVAK
jgi:pilus assembly protein CpaD